MRGVNFSLPILELVDEFLLKLHSLIRFHLNQKCFLWVEKRFLWSQKEFYRLKFITIYFFCDRGLRSVCDLCVRVLIQEKIIYYLFQKKIILNKDIFIPTFIDFYLPGNINMFVCQDRCDSFILLLDAIPKELLKTII